VLKLSLITKLLLSVTAVSAHLFCTEVQDRPNSVVGRQSQYCFTSVWNTTIQSTKCKRTSSGTPNPPLPSPPAELNRFSRILLSCGQALDPWPLLLLLRKSIVTSHHGKPLPKRTTTNIQTNKHNSP